MGKKVVSGAVKKKDALKGHGPLCPAGHASVMVRLVKPIGRSRFVWWCHACQLQTSE